MSFNSNFKQRGFTLIELLTVIAIISLLLVISIPNLNTARTKGQDAKRKANLKQIQAALEMYKADNATSKTYPATAGTNNVQGVSTNNTLYAVLHSGTIVYLPNFPLDPTDPKNYFYYIPANGNATYTLCAHLEYSGDSELNNNAICNALANNNECGGKCNYGVTNP